MATPSALSYGGMATLQYLTGCARAVPPVLLTDSVPESFGCAHVTLPSGDTCREVCPLTSSLQVRDCPL